MVESWRIRDLVQAKLAGRKIDVVGFIDELLDMAKEAGEIRCRLATEQRLRFEFGDQTCEVDLEGARGKLRMLCARLSVLCNETGGSAVSAYGGHGLIANLKDQWTARFQNTPGEQEFSIAFVAARQRIAP